MATQALVPKLIVGTFLGAVIGLLAVVNIYIAGVLVLLGLYLLGRTEHGRLFERAADVHRDEVARANRAAYWREFPLSDFPHEQHNGRHTDREFTAYAECEHGHRDFHPMGEKFERDGRERVVRRCVNYPECTSLWSELA